MTKSQRIAREMAICLAYMEHFSMQELINLWKLDPPDPIKRPALGPELDGHILKLAAEERANGRRLSEGFKRREFEAFKRMRVGK